MKRILTLLIAAATTLAAAVTSAYAAYPDSIYWPEGAFSDISLEKTDSRIIATFNIDAKAFPLKANREITILPMLTAANHSISLDPVTIAGRTRYFQHRRARDIKAPAILLQADDSFRYSAITDYQDWMQDARLVIGGSSAGCCGTPSGPFPDKDLAAIHAPEPIIIETTPSLPLNAAMIYVEPKKEIVKTRSFNGKAYIDFPVNQIGIYPDYRRNPEELAAIQTTIDRIRADQDVNITSISFKGYASPEGPYDNNDRLARGRTEALMGYVRALYAYPESAMHASWEAEDWDGLKAQLRKLDITNRDAILDIIADPSLSYDAKDQAIKNRFPQQYAYLLREVYPALRHSDYMVEFTVKNYVDVTEIAAVYAENPSKLSNDEIFLFADTYPRDSPEYREVMMTAVSLFPTDPEANFNAGVAAMADRDLENALSFLRKARQLGMEEATPLIERIENYIKATSQESQKTE